MASIDAAGASRRGGRPTRSRSGRGIDRRLEAPGGRASLSLKPLPNTAVADAQNSFSADSPYFASYVENEMRSLDTMDDTLRDIAARTKTFGKCGALMAESTRRLALACRLRRPFNMSEDEKEMEVQGLQREREVLDRRRAVGEDMASLLAVMSEVSVSQSFDGVILQKGTSLSCRYVSPEFFMSLLKDVGRNSKCAAANV